MDPMMPFTGRKEHRRNGQFHFAEVTVRAEPCAGESMVILSDEVLAILREVFGPDFEHHRHCVKSAVAVQFASCNVTGGFPHAGAASFRAEVIQIRLSGNAGKDVSGFLLTAAGMDAIDDFLVTWESEKSGSPREGDEEPAAKPDEIDDLQYLPDLAEIEELEARAARMIAQLTDSDFQVAVYKSAYISLRVDLDDGWSEEELRVRHPALVDYEGPFPDQVREAWNDALAGFPMRYNNRSEM